MASHFEGIRRVKLLKTRNLSLKTVPNGIDRLVETSVDLAGTLGPDSIASLSGVEVSNPVVD